MNSALQSLIAEATRSFHDEDEPPIMMASTNQGIILFSPDSMRDIEAKDDFANDHCLVWCFRRRAHFGILNHEGKGG